MSEFEDGILPYMHDEYGETGDPDTDLSDMLIIDPDSELDDQRNDLSDSDPEIDLDAGPQRYGLKSKFVLEAAKLFEDSRDSEDPLIAAVGHLGLAGLLAGRKYRVLTRLQRHGLPTTPSLLTTEDTKRQHEGMSDMLTEYYLAFVKHLSRHRMSERTSTKLSKSAISAIARSSYKYQLSYQLVIAKRLVGLVLH